MSNIRVRIGVYLILLAIALGGMYFLRKQNQNSKKTEERQRIQMPRDLREIRAEGKLRLLAPYGFIPTDSLKKGGIEHLDFIRSLSQRSRLEVLLSFEDNTMKAIQQLLVGEVDALLFSVEKTAQLDSLPLSWVEEDVTLPLVLAQRGDSARLIRKQIDLNDKTVTIPSHSPYKLFINHLTDDLGISIQIQEDSLYNTEQLLMMVQSGKIDYTICDGEDVARYKTLFPHLDFSLPMSHALRRGWVVRRTSPILKDSLMLWLQ